MPPMPCFNASDIYNNVSIHSDIYTARLLRYDIRCARDAAFYDFRDYDVIWQIFHIASARMRF